jgi:hypothetical protein
VTGRWGGYDANQMPNASRVEIANALQSDSIAWSARLERLLSRGSVQTVVVFCVIAIASMRIVSTYETYNQTFDEGAHIAAGLETLDLGTFDREPLYPPLTRMAVAAGPYLQGSNSDPRLKNIFVEGNRVLYSSFNYDRTLAAARIGILPFFWILCLSVFFWARKEFGVVAGLAALLIITHTQVVLGHAGMATADIPAAATLVLALFAFRTWLLAPIRIHSVFLGLAISAALLTKFSNVVFLLVCVPLLAVLHMFWGQEKFTIRRWLGQKMIVLCVIFLCVWGMYRFEWHPLNVRANYDAYLQERYANSPRALSTMQRFSRIPIPAPDLIHGLEEVSAINADKRPAYLLGEVYLGGRVAFFPVALSTKAPFALLILGLAGTVLGCWRFLRFREVGLIAIAACWMVVLAIAMQAQINIGVRHVLSVFGFWAILAGCTIAWLLKSLRSIRVAGALVALLLGWVMIGSWSSHSAPIAYFNFLAGGHPEKVLVDSDLDWGQDLKKLNLRLRELGVQQVWLDYLGTAIPEKHLTQQVRYLPPENKVSGWVAISLTDLEEQRAAFGWLNAYPVAARAGDSINIYYVPPAAADPATSAH